MANVLENYKKYMRENALLFESSEGPKAIITDDVEYDNFVKTIMEGIDDADGTVRSVLDREREMLLEEASSLLAGPEAIAFAVSAFPMITTVYSTPILTEGTTVYPINKSTHTVPRLKWKGRIIDETGAVNEVEFPTAMQAVRPGSKTLTLTSQYGNLFDLLSLDKAEFRISKKGFMLTGVDLTETDSGGATITHNIDVYAGIDARGNFATEFTVTAADGVDAIFLVTGNVNNPTGDINWSVVVKEYTGTSTFVADDIKIKFRLFGIGNNKSVVKVAPDTDAIDINLDVEDSFEVEEIEEVIQDWQSMYNIDIFAQMTDMVKLQIDLNRDWDIADLLLANESKAVASGLSRTLDFSALPAIAYENYGDVLKSIVPKILIIKERIAKLQRRDANIIMCGTDAAALLKSLQDYAISYDGKRGEFGLSDTGMASFSKMKILGSNAIPDDKLYILVKGSTPSEAVILNSVYKPIYTVKETTNSKTRLFIKTRQSVDLVRDDLIGFVKIENYGDYL